MVLIASCMLLAAFLKLTAGRPLDHRSPFTLLPRLLNQTSTSPSLNPSSTQLPQLSIVPVSQSSPVLPAVSVAPASSANNNRQPQNRSSTIAPAVSTQIPGGNSPGAGTLNSAVTTSGLNITTTSNPPILATTMTDCSETAQAGNNSGPFPLTSSLLSPTPAPLSNASNSQTTFPLISPSNAVPAAPNSTVTEAPAVAPSSAAAVSSSAKAPNALTAMSSTAIPTPSQPTSSIVVITITRNHTITIQPSGASATPAKPPALTLPSVLTTNPSGSTITMTVPAGGMSSVSGGQLSIVPINPQSAPAPTATITITVGMMTTTTTAYFVSESHGPTGG